MSEYWVSQAKHYCKVCNCYIADNKASRSHHENGAKHKEKVELLQKQKREEKLHGARSEIELKHQLAEIEKAAKEAIATDRAEQDGFFYQNAGGRLRPPPPPASRPPGFAKPSQTGDEAAGEEGIEEDDGSGMYTVKGQTYLQGKIHEEKIRTGMECEIFVEADDEWYKGRIDARHETPIPHTTLFLVTFDVEYSVKTHTLGDEVVVKDKGIKSDRIRLLAEPDGTLPGYIEPGAIPAVVLNEHTGIGMWQTVAVREVDEEAELIESERVRELMYKGRTHQIDEPAAKAKRQLLQEGEDGFEDHTDSALSAYDPYARQRGIYKGIKLQEDANFKEQIESVAQGASVGFKKRKTTIKTEPSSSANASSGNNSSSGVVNDQSAPVLIKAESSVSSSSVFVNADVTSASNSKASSTDTTSKVDHNTALAQAPTTTTAPTTAAAPVAPVVAGPVVMKIGNLSGGGSAKRKFRVREPSP